MQDVYERVVELLGKTIDDVHCGRFVRDIGYEPKFNGTYLFAKDGLVLMHHKRFLVAAFFQIEGDEAQDWLDPYQGNLPGGIGLADSRQEVATKLGILPVLYEPSAVDVNAATMDTYASPPVILTFSFGAKTPVMTSLIVRLDDEHMPEVCKEPEDARPEASLTAVARRKRPAVDFRRHHRN